MNKQPNITEKTKNTIVRAFCEIYETTPIDKIYVKDVMSVAGYNRSTFYQYFEDIYSLCDFVENDILETIRLRINESGNNENALVEIFEQKEYYLRALLGKYGSIRFLDRLKKEILPHIKLNLDTMSPGIQPYIEEFHIYTTLSLFRLWLSRNKDISQQELFGLIHTLYNSGYRGLTYGNTEEV